MHIRKRIRNLKKYLERFQGKAQCYVALPDTEPYREKLVELGFSYPLISGERLLPPASAGPASGRNADGYEIVHRDRPMETHYRQWEWQWTEMHGRDRVGRSEIKDIPYPRYPRTKIPPFSIELFTLMTTDSAPTVVAGPFDVATAMSDQILLNTVHVFVELFGECCLIDDDLRRPKLSKWRRLNWEVLPPGRHPWPHVKSMIASVLTNASGGNQIVLERRYTEINSYQPEFHATGLGGFSRYIVFGWQKQGLYILESTETDNATYVLKNDWERVSAMSKAEVLSEQVHYARLIHRESWFGELRRLMRAEGIEKP